MGRRGWSLRGLATHVGAAWLISAGAVLALTILGRLGGYDIGLREMAIGFLFLALGPPLWFLLLSWILGGDDEG